MPYEIIIDNLPSGYALEAGKCGQTVKVVTAEFVSSEDGDLFISRLEGFPSEVIRKIAKKTFVTESTVDHLVAVVRRDKTATVYLNEVTITSTIRIKRAIKAGEEVYKDDITDIEKILLEGVDVPNDAGFLIVFSVGWRKGLYYDFRPLLPNEPKKRIFDLSDLLGKFYSYLLFQERWKISEEIWSKILSQGWFPFISLSTDSIKKMIAHAKEEWSIDELLSTISLEVKMALPSMLDKWQRIAVFCEHMPFFRVAAEHFNKDEHISCTSVLYPRIEGVMRSFHLIQAKKEKATQNSIVDSIMYGKEKQHSLLLPNRFRKFLLEIYFASFDPEGPKPLSRHTISHGVAEVHKFNLKASTIGVLLLEQLSFFIKEGHDG